MQKYGVLFANGDHWMSLKQFSLVTMRDFVMGKQDVEERMKEEAQCLVDKLMSAQRQRDTHSK
ncbi:Cytochrome P450 [Apodemus speciosus]|uniref:Cytochrome P450 n=1 Tax=Apodemus speciosus TaxID=105296 RepID=A0ABQ0EXH4_APOSI